MARKTRVCDWRSPSKGLPLCWEQWLLAMCAPLGTSSELVSKVLCEGTYGQGLCGVFVLLSS